MYFMQIYSGNTWIQSMTAHAIGFENSSFGVCKAGRNVFCETDATTVSKMDLIFSLSHFELS